MPINKKTELIIGLMINHELVIGELYSVYAEKIPSYKIFWQDIAREETGHAQALKSLKEEMEQSEIIFPSDRFNSEAINFSINYIREKINKAQDNVSAREALITARDIENSLLEKNYFQVAESDSVNLKNTLKFLSEGTKEHLKKIQTEISKTKGAA